MEASLVLVLVGASAVSGFHLRHARDIPGASSGSGSGSSSFASSSSFSSSSGTKVAPGPGGSGNFNAFASNFPGPPAYGGGNYMGGGGGNGGQFGQPQQPYGFPQFNPFVPQYGQQYPYTPFPAYPAQFDFMSFLNQYFQSLQNFQEQAAHNGGASGYPIESNEVGGSAMGTYSPQGGYGSASIYPPAEGGLDNRFGGDDETPQNSLGGPVSSVSGSFKPPSGSSFGVFTSSASGSSDVNGKKTSFKQSSVGINDNGKVTTYTAHNP